MPTDADTSGALSPMDPDVMRCPFEYYADLHADPAAARDEGPLGWVVAGHAEIAAISLDTKGFSSSFYGPDGPQLTGVSPEPYTDEVQVLRDQLHPLENALFSCDPPTHTRQKAIAIKSLNAHRIRGLEPKIREEANALVDAFVDDGRCDFYAQFAIWLPLILISHTLGCDRDDLKTFKVWTDHIADGYLAVLDNDQRAEVLKSVRAYQDYMLPRIEARRESPTDDLLSALVNTEIDPDDEALGGQELSGPRQLTTAEVLAAVSQLLAAGNHTTTNLLANTMVLLVEHPEAMEALRVDPSLIPRALDESLRRDAPLRATYRVATKDADIGGTTIPAGSLVPMHWGGSGHDPAVFPDPQRFDIHRPNAKKHHSFGKGPHFCVGSQLARAQSRIAFEVLLGRLDDIRFAGGKKPKRAAQFPFTSYEAVELEFSKGEQPAG